MLPLSISIICSFLAVTSSQTVTINTELGQITGIEDSKSWYPNIVYEFRGIPYAIPPVADLRFRQSKMNTSSWNGIFDGTTYGPQCVQPNTPKPPLTMSEDCLYLNIWTTKSILDNANNTLVPVMFYVHGGGYHTGTGADLEYNGINFIGPHNDFVYVTINYRLNSLGFLDNEAIYNEDPTFKSYGGLNGIYDQIVALNYVKKYISNYGGNPNQITAFGESAGGESICILLVSPIATDLFQRGIVQSGSCNGAWGPRNLEQGIAFGNQQLQNAGYPINNLTYLRNIDAKTFISKITTDVSVDGLVLNDTPYNMYLKSDTKLTAKDAVMFGFCSLDGLAGWPYNYGSAPKNEEQYKQYIAKQVHNTTQQDLIVNFYYPPSDFPAYQATHANSYEIAWYTINADVCVTCPTFQMAENSMLKQMTSRVYVYDFMGSGENNEYYAPHASELPFVFDQESLVSAYSMPWSQNLSDNVNYAWTNFGKTGYPNITNKAENVNIVWSEYDKTSQSGVLLKNGNGGIENVKMFTQNYRRNACEFWFDEVGNAVVLNMCNAIW